MSRRRKNSREAFPIAEFVIPHYCSSSVVQRAQRGIRPEVAVAPSPTFCFSGDCIVVNAKQPPAVDVKQSRLAIKTRRHPIRGAVGTRFDESAIRTRRGFGLRDRAPTRINAARPGLIYERRGDQMLSTRA